MTELNTPDPFSSRNRHLLTFVSAAYQSKIYSFQFIIHRWQ